MSTKHITILVLVGVAVLVALIALMSSLYSVDQREYVLQMRFGKVEAIREQPGLYIKAPFVDAHSAH